LSSDTDREVNVSIRFVIPPFEISLSTAAKRSEFVSVLVDLLNGIKQRQNDLVESVAGIDLTKIKSVVTPAISFEDPIEKVARKMEVSAERLKGILRVENDVPFIIEKDKFGSPEKAAMVLVYTHQFGLDKVPTHKEVAASFRQSGFKTGFGKSVKGHLQTRKKIQVVKDKITLIGSGIADAEKEVNRILAVTAK